MTEPKTHTLDVPGAVLTYDIRDASRPEAGGSGSWVGNGLITSGCRLYSCTMRSGGGCEVVRRPEQTPLWL